MDPLKQIAEPIAGVATKAGLFVVDQINESKVIEKAAKEYTGDTAATGKGLAEQVFDQQLDQRERDAKPQTRPPLTEILGRAIAKGYDQDQPP
ncbi:SMP domain-containing protein [Plasmodiophora brassicae]|uniref:Uncharacterized protein n=1 Tax=Plasmodiophora brassicae TaxID=37360 RepID=A0A0G4J459_PLABS|nr:hypothetical protein PBRA_002336 [Plasmodiophora brassicae]SPQ98923.1 unnamed protein product [Plasmodiophora brassicae]